MITELECNGNSTLRGAFQPSGGAKDDPGITFRDLGMKGVTRRRSVEEPNLLDFVRR